MSAQFDLVLPSFFLAVFVLCMWVGFRALARRVRSFLWASWRRIPQRSTRYAVGSDCHHREFVGRDL